MQENEQVQNNELLLREMVDLMIHDSENLDRTMSYLTEDCVWVIEPGGTEYHGAEELRPFIGIAMSSRGHDNGSHQVEIVSSFFTSDHLCIEYTHGMMLSGFLGKIIKVNAGTLRYCIVYHVRDGKIDHVREYINSPLWLLNTLLQAMLAGMHHFALRKLQMG